MRQAFHVIKQNRVLLLAAAFLFLSGWVLGGLNSKMWLGLVEDAFKNLQDIAQEAQNHEHPLETSWLLLMNNARACLMMMLFGSLLVIPGVFVLFLNGLMIGVLFGMADMSALSYLGAVVFGILPHGIFELSAIFISGMFGLKLGGVWFRPLAGMTRWQSYLAVWREVGRTAWLIASLLIVAAVVEATITPLLLQSFGT